MQMQVRVRVQVQVQRLRDSTVSLAGGSTAAKTVAKGPLAFQEQNCPGWMREMSSPIMLPPVATSEAPLTCAQSDEALLIAQFHRDIYPNRLAFSRQSNAVSPESDMASFLGESGPALA